MSDIFSVKKRSEIMRKVRNKNTNIELILRKALFKDGVRFRVKNKLFGKPDIIISEEKIAIFCDGDFWHGRNFRKEADGYKDFWKEKIRTNIERETFL
jgi:DNA mismatch endonuclease (patch repair protein)